MGRLKKCPFCGGTGCLHGNYSYKTRSYFVFVKCDICGAQGKTYRSEVSPEEVDWDNGPCQDAAIAWNMRRKPDPDEEAFEKVLEQFRHNQ